MIASPLRPRYRQEQGIAAAGRLAHRGTPYGASLSFATTTHLWPLSDPPSRKPPQRVAKPHSGPPGQFRAAPLPLQCWIPPVRAPGQDLHLRSQHPCPAHPRSPSRYALRLSRRQPRHRLTGRSGNINTNNNRREVGPLQAAAPGPLQVAAPSCRARRRSSRSRGQARRMRHSVASPSPSPGRASTCTS